MGDLNGGQEMPGRLEAQIATLTERVNGLTVSINQRFADSKLAVDAALTAAKEAVTTALSSAEKAVIKAEESARETMKSHNDLIRQSRDRDETYASKSDLAHTNESVTRLEGTVSRLLGGLVLVGILIPLATIVLVHMFK